MKLAQGSATLRKNWRRAQFVVCARLRGPSCSALGPKMQIRSHHHLLKRMRRMLLVLHQLRRGRLHAFTTFVERCILAASNINTNRCVPASGLSASPNKLIRFTTTSLRSQALLRRRTKILSALALFRRGVVHACMICSAPTIICGNTLFTSSSSLRNAANVTALLRHFNGFRRSISKKCFVFKPDGNATKPR